jgi:acetyl esterase/lipase
MGIPVRLPLSAFLGLLPATLGAQQVIPLSPDTSVKPGPSDYDPHKLEKDRFAIGAELETPQLTFFSAASSAAPSACAIICPGGAYRGERMDNEGYKPALWLNSIGMSAFVLRYRLPHGEAGRGLTPPPLDDLLRAIRLVRANSSEWKLDPRRVGIMGWSAGGHLAATGGTLFRGPDRPDFLMLIYPVITMRGATHKESRSNLLGNNLTEPVLHLYSADEQVTPRTPPAFIAVARDDAAVPPENSVRFADALKASGVPCTLKIYEHGGHGFCMGAIGTDSMNWPVDCEAWARASGLLPGP